MARKSGSNRFNRRSSIKALTATGATLAAGFDFAPAVRAANGVHQRFRHGPKPIP
jgi:hypothetical protein